MLRISKVVKTVLHLGFRQVFWYGIYQLGLRSGHYRRTDPIRPYPEVSYQVKSPFLAVDREQLLHMLGKDSAQELLDEANDVCSGDVRLFGGAPTPLELQPTHAQKHWTAYEGHPEAAGVDDLKLIWEPARFGWVYPLGRAYLISQDERFPAAFWAHLEDFSIANPPNQGPNWSSAQEVALRLLALLFAAQVFDRSSHTTPTHRALLAGMVAAHAQRIPPSLSYANAQNNNHLLTEALGLLAAGAALPDHPQANRWKKLGWHWFNAGIQKQVHANGVYTQHSMNYHRLMLHTALQVQMIEPQLPQKTRERLSAAAAWLIAQVDPVSGCAPNVGSNDGAHILPLAGGGFSDYRPVGQAAARAFLGQPAFLPGPWDELSLWLGLDCSTSSKLTPFPMCSSVHRLGDQTTWGTLRAVHFFERPSHADQLHVDLWWRGQNIALDAGTYRYTANAPWDNTLAETRVHNTVTINQMNQMQRAGRFLWLDWAQARLINPTNHFSGTLTAEHTGYARQGAIHRRALSLVDPRHWQITDTILPVSRRAEQSYSLAVHWLLPDWPWTMDGTALTLSCPQGGRLQLFISTPPPGAMQPALVRAGSYLAGDGPAQPILGWYSPTYNHKVPALSFFVTCQSALPLEIVSDWFLLDA